MTPRLVLRSPLALARPVLLFGLVLVLLGFSFPARRTGNGTVGQAAMRVQIDPVTGALVPFSASGGAPLAPGAESALSHSTQGLTVEIRPDGTQFMDLQGRFMEAVVATIDASGTTQLGCLPSGQAERFVRQPMPIHVDAAPAAPVER